jgi:hypothetical protein
VCALQDKRRDNFLSVLTLLLVFREEEMEVKEYTKGTEKEVSNIKKKGPQNRRLEKSLSDMISH